MQRPRDAHLDWHRRCRDVETAPERGATGRQRGAAQGRRRAAVSPRTRRAFPLMVQQVRQRGWPCGNRPIGPPKMLAAAQPPPLIAEAGQQQPEAACAARAPLPCCLSRARRRPHPPNLRPIAAPGPACQGSARQGRAHARPCRRGVGVAGGAGSRGPGIAARDGPPTGDTSRRVMAAGNGPPCSASLGHVSSRAPLAALCTGPYP